MPTKKRASKPAPARQGRRRKADASPFPRPADPAVRAETVQGNRILPVLFFVGLAALAGLLWWSLRHRNAAAETAPQAIATPVEAPQAAAPVAATGRDVAAQPVARPPAPVNVPKISGAHREPAGNPAAEAAQTHPAAAATASASDNGSLSLVLGSNKPLTMRCWGSAESPARLDVFGRHNRLVRSVVSTEGSDGWQTLSWDGTNEQGSQVAEGHYYVRPSQKAEQVILDLQVKN